MEEGPYASAPRVFWIVDNGSAHPPKTFGAWLSGTLPQARAVHTPVHASWVDQEELFLTILTKKGLTPRDFQSREEAEARIRGFLARWNRHPRPFRRTYTREDLRATPGIPPKLRRELTERFQTHAQKRWRERCARVAVRFHGRYAHVGAYCYDEEPPGKVESLPTHLCQLEYVGRPDMWGFASYKYSTERYKRSYLPSGSMGGTPEECFDCAGLAYLQ